MSIDHATTYVIYLTVHATNFLQAARQISNLELDENLHYILYKSSHCGLFKTFILLWRYVTDNAGNWSINVNTDSAVRNTL